MSAQSLILKLETLTPWICGSGRTGGRLYDIVPVKDADGLPYVPGRHLKGLIRSALERSAPTTIAGERASGPELARIMFGASSEDDDRDYMPEGSYFGGLLRVSSAEFSAADRALALALSEHDRNEVFFVTQQSTAIGEDGTAKDKSLRVSQMAVPLTLFAELAADTEAFDGNSSRTSELQGWELAAIGQWVQVIRHALPMARGVGANRQRGAGRAIISIDKGI